MNNTVTINLDELIAAGSYTSASQAYGKRLNQQAAELITALGIDLDPVLTDVEGFEETASGIDGMYEAAELWSGGAGGLDDLSGYEKHGIYHVDDSRADRHMVRVDSADYRVPNACYQFDYVADGAVGMGTYTLVPDRSRKDARKPKPFATVAEMLREAAKMGLQMSNAQRQRFCRKVPADQRTRERLAEWIATGGKDPVLKTSELPKATFSRPRRPVVGNDSQRHEIIRGRR